MPFTNRAIDELLAVTASQDLTGDQLVHDTAAALAELVDASYIAVFELEPGTRTAYGIGELALVPQDEPDDGDDYFWQTWDTWWCSWTEPGSPWFGKQPADQPLNVTGLFPTLRAAREATLRTPYAQIFEPTHEVVIPLESAPGRTRRILVDRPWSERPFTDAEMLLLRLAQPHLDRAIARAVAGVPAKDLLSPRELEILAYLRGGSSTKDIAAALWVSPSTVRKHLENVYAKLGVHGRTEALARVYGHPGQAQVG